MNEIERWERNSIDRERQIHRDKQRRLNRRFRENGTHLLQHEFQIAVSPWIL